MKSPSPYDLQDFLLADDHYLTLGYKTHMQKVKDSKSKAKEAKGKEAKGDVDHLQAFERFGVTWPPVDDSGILETAGYLCRRQMEIVYLLDKVYPIDKYPVESVHDINMSMAWQKMGQELSPICHCLVGSSTPWLRVRRRALCGAEAHKSSS